MSNSERNWGGSAQHSVLGGDDLLFGWGGDEFLILCFNISEAAARDRIDEMDADLALTMLPGASDPVRLIVSYGLAAFTGASGIEQAIDQADEAMYASTSRLASAAASSPVNF